MLQLLAKLKYPKHCDNPLLSTVGWSSTLPRCGLDAGQATLGLSRTLWQCRLSWQTVAIVHRHFERHADGDARVLHRRVLLGMTWER